MILASMEYNNLKTQKRFHPAWEGTIPIWFNEMPHDIRLLLGGSHDQATE
jgi:hypothetical protein